MIRSADARRLYGLTRCHELTRESRRCQAIEGRKAAREVALIGEAGLVSDMRERTSLGEEPSRAGKPELHLICVRRQAECALEDAKKMEFAQRAHVSQLVKGHRMHRPLSQIVTHADHARGRRRRMRRDARIVRAPEHDVKAPDALDEPSRAVDANEWTPQLLED